MTAAEQPRRRWGTIRTSVAAIVHAPPERVAATLLDSARWPRTFPLTIAGVRPLRSTPSRQEVMVEHRREGEVLNVLTIRGPGIVELEELKRRYAATFVNRFEPVPGGTRYVIDAEVRLAPPFALLAPLLHAVVRRALRRYTLEPLRAAVEDMAAG